MCGAGGWSPSLWSVGSADLTAAVKSMRGAVGLVGEAAHGPPNVLTRHNRQREIEAKLILSSNFKGWNISENIIQEKNLSNSPWEFGYAVGLSRPLALAARPYSCTLCPENFTAGVELYGGFGHRHSFGLKDTSHFLASRLAGDLPRALRPRR